MTREEYKKNVETLRSLSREMERYLTHEKIEAMSGKQFTSDEMYRIEVLAISLEAIRAVQHFSYEVQSSIF